MNNYDEIAKETVDKVLKETALTTLKGLMYECAYEAAKLQAERFNKDLDKCLYEN